jgi:hypothetical protein
VLDDGSPNHSSRTSEKTSSDPLDWGEVYAYPAKAWVDEQIADRNEDYQAQGVEIIDDIIWNAISHHNSGLRCQVIDNLVIWEPFLSFSNRSRDFFQ